MLGWCPRLLAITSFCPTTSETGKTQSRLIDATIYDFREITLHVTEPLDWSHANPPLLIKQFQERSSIIANAYAAAGG